jgi:hypothetical protein
VTTETNWRHDYKNITCIAANLYHGPSKHEGPIRAHSSSAGGAILSEIYLIDGNERQYITYTLEYSAHLDLKRHNNQVLHYKFNQAPNIKLWHDNCDCSSIEFVFAL